jgi:hypothetical protein
MSVFKIADVDIMTSFILVQIYIIPPSIFHFFKDIKKFGADLVCGVSGQLKNMFEKIRSQESMR